MRKWLLLVSAAVMALLLTGCVESNYQTVDTTYRFDRAQIKMPDGTYISGKVEQWRDYEDSDQLQVTIDGKTYLTGGENIVLISEGGQAP